MEGLGIIAIRPRHLGANDGDSVALEHGLRSNCNGEQEFGFLAGRLLELLHRLAVYRHSFIVERDQNLRARSADVGGRMDCVSIPPTLNSVPCDAELAAHAEFRKHLIPTTWCQMRAPSRQPCCNGSLSVTA